MRLEASLVPRLLRSGTRNWNCAIVYISCSGEPGNEAKKCHMTETSHCAARVRLCDLEVGGAGLSTIISIVALAISSG